MTAHSNYHDGLRQHSVGNQYPWIVVGIGDDFYPLQGETGERGPRFTTNEKKTAHVQTEDWIEDRLSGNPRNTRIREYKLTIPNLGHGGKSLYSAKHFDRFENHLLNVFGGYRIFETQGGKAGPRGFVSENNGRQYTITSLNTQNIADILEYAKELFPNYPVGCVSRFA